MLEKIWYPIKYFSMGTDKKKYKTKYDPQHTHFANEMSEFYI